MRFFGVRLAWTGPAAPCAAPQVRQGGGRREVRTANHLAISPQRFDSVVQGHNS